MAAIEERTWTEFEIDMDSLTEVTDAGPKEEWNAYRADMRKIDDSVTPDDEHEIPFWAMMPFWEHVDQMAKQSGWMAMEYRRVKRDGKNQAEFR